MTVQTFIVNYNYTFKYIHERFGKEAVVELWKKIEKEFCKELHEAIREGGLPGAEAFFYGEDGITARELPDATHGSTENTYFEKFDRCPSVAELVERGKDRYPFYCEHCYWLYAPAFRENGFVYDVEYGLQTPDHVSDSCYIRAYKAPEKLAENREEGEK